MFASQIMAGFEVARLGDHCMVDGTGHSPDRNMPAHYRIAIEHGMTTARDGLPWWLPIEPRLRIAHDAGMQVIWDLDHWWLHPDPDGYVRRVISAVQAICPGQPFWCCFNELLVHEHFCGQSFGDVLAQSKAMLARLRTGIADVRLITAEPAHHAGELAAHVPWQSDASVIGLNLYPHHLQWDVSTALIEAWLRFGKPVMISETSLNPNHPQRWRGIGKKADWLRYCLDEIEIARSAGADVVGLCWYPLIDSPWWGFPDRERWPHGLIRQDMSVDPELSARFKPDAASVTQQAQQFQGLQAVS